MTPARADGVACQCQCGQHADIDNVDKLSFVLPKESGGKQPPYSPFYGCYGVQVQGGERGGGGDVTQSHIWPWLLLGDRQSPLRVHASNATTQSDHFLLLFFWDSLLLPTVLRRTVILSLSHVYPMDLVPEKFPGTRGPSYPQVVINKGMCIKCVSVCECAFYSIWLALTPAQ